MHAMKIDSIAAELCNICAELVQVGVVMWLKNNSMWL